MNRRAVLALVPAMMMAGCVAGGFNTVQMGPDGKPLARAYSISGQTAQEIPYRFLDSVNTMRQARGIPTLSLNPYLNAAAETHSRDMSAQNRPWHFGSDGSSPLSRVQRAGYAGRLVGENISETYQTELETLSVWMSTPEQREVILDPSARDLGFAWYQEPNGKIWWTMITGG